MNRIISSTHTSDSIKINKVLRNTYFLLGLTISFSALMATISTVFSLPPPHFLITLVGCYGLMFLTYKLADRATGILAAFGFTGFLGYCLGPMLNYFFYSHMGDLIILSLAGTALVFLSCSLWILTTKKDVSFLNSIILTGSVVLFFAVLANLFFQIPALHLSISVMFILFSACSILWETNRIIQNGETNYIRATISLYVSLYNIFTSLLSIFGFMRNKE